MTNRREFLQTGAVMSVLAMHGLVPRNAAAAAVAPRGASFVPHLAVYDDRYAESRDFAAAAGAFGTPVRAVEHGDVTAIYDELDVAWRTRPSSIAGVTQFGPMFVIERLAAERGMRLVLRAEHRPSADGTLSHVITGPSAALTLAGDLSAAGLEWPAAMGALVCRATAAAMPVSSITLASRVGPPELARDGAAATASFSHYYTPQRMQQGYEAALDGPLYTWLVAPVARS
jgi:hypothetical protein